MSQGSIYSGLAGTGDNASEESQEKNVQNVEIVGNPQVLQKDAIVNNIAQVERQQVVSQVQPIQKQEQNQKMRPVNQEQRAAQPALKKQSSQQGQEVFAKSVQSLSSEEIQLSLKQKPNTATYWLAVLSQWTKERSKNKSMSK